MALPTFQDLMKPALLLSQTEQYIGDAVNILAKEFSITAEELQQQTPKRKTPVFYGRVSWAVTYLVQAKLISRPSRGRFVITEEGLGILEKNPLTIDVKYLKTETSFLDQRKTNQKRASKATSEDDETILTPEELIDSAFAEINSALSVDLLNRVLAQSPQFFERLVVELLQSMGYGEAGNLSEAIGKSGDGGIDGIIHQDNLGLDVVYIQAKRYEPGNTVGRPDLQKFIGSLSGFSATKGVFITTSSFSSNVADYLRSVQQRVVTIDGTQLVELMIQNGVGVRPEQTYTIHRIDEDLFVE